MALLVPNIGELDSLRYLINQSNHVADREHNAPRDLVLKLFSSDTTPGENDVPSQSAYYEPYQNDGSFGYGSAIETGYPLCINNRTEAAYDYDSQYGILLNGSRWQITQVFELVEQEVQSSDGVSQKECLGEKTGRIPRRAHKKRKTKKDY